MKWSIKKPNFKTSYSLANIQGHKSNEMEATIQSGVVRKEFIKFTNFLIFKGKGL